MKTATLKNLGLVAGILGSATLANASSDYGPATWNPVCSGHWYTTGYGHKFHVHHDMEGYYASTISYFKNCSTTASIHYCVNGKQDTSTDSAAGAITQMVLEANYAWHVLCWNRYCTGTEHEGFASNPAWYTTAMYNATAGISAHEATKFGYAKDRNHMIGHNEWKNSHWTAYAGPAFGINTGCNTHTDPGSYWNWSYLMTQIGGGGGGGGTIVDNSAAGFSCSANWATGTSDTDKYGSNYRYHSTVASSDEAVWSASVSGSKTIYVWYPEGSNRSTAASYIFSVSGGTHTEVVNQQITGGEWVNQGTYTLAASPNTIKLSCWEATGFVVVADAVQWQ
jgi:hypothetical protein